MILINAIKASCKINNDLTMQYKKDYQERLTHLENYLDFALDVTDATMRRKGVTWHLTRAHQLYNRLTVTCLSFIHLLPNNRYFKPAMEFWDFFSIASLARNIIENYHLLFYTGVDKVSPEEMELRLEVFQYHLNSEKYKLYQEFGQTSSSLEDFATNLPLDREKIKNNPLFLTLDKARAGKILKGNEFMCISRDELLNRMPFRTNEITPLYRFLSAQTHSAPLSFFTQSNERGRGLENELEVGYIIMCMDIVTKYLLAAILDLIRLFPDSESALDAKKLVHVREKFSTY
jgi:hypothetical protein